MRCVCEFLSRSLLLLSFINWILADKYQSNLFIHKTNYIHTHTYIRTYVPYTFLKCSPINCRNSSMWKGWWTVSVAKGYVRDSPMAAGSQSTPATRPLNPMALQQRLVKCWADSLALLSYRQPQTEYGILTAFNVLYVLACELGDSSLLKSDPRF